MDLKESYIRAYLHELCESIEKEDVLKDVKFHYAEANVDLDLREKISDFINNKKNRISNISSVKCNNDIYKLNKENFSVKSCIGEKTDKKVSNKENVNANRVVPDLLLVFDIEGIKYNEILEVKSTLVNIIPGSSIQQIDLNRRTIFVQHTKKGEISLTFGKYKDALDGKIPFPDRSPRPRVSFNKLKQWNNDNVSLKNNNLEIKIDSKSDRFFKEIKDWQDVLAKEWLEVVKSDRKSNESWYNNNLRKFILEFLSYYDDRNESEKNELKKKIKSNIK